jgi:hypothetical protein
MRKKSALAMAGFPVLGRISVLVVATATMVGVGISAAGASSIPSGERVVGQNVLEPAYNDEQAGSIGFVSTPMNASMHANPT